MFAHVTLLRIELTLALSLGSVPALDLLDKLLQFDPARRLDCTSALHQYVHFSFSNLETTTNLRNRTQPIFLRRFFFLFLLERPTSTATTSDGRATTVESYARSSSESSAITTIRSESLISEHFPRIDLFSSRLVSSLLLYFCHDFLLSPRCNRW